MDGDHIRLRNGFPRWVSIARQDGLSSLLTEQTQITKNTPAAGLGLTL
jgi:hypothetical protein